LVVVALQELSMVQTVGLVLIRSLAQSHLTVVVVVITHLIVHQAVLAVERVMAVFLVVLALLVRVSLVEIQQAQVRLSSLVVEVEEQDKLVLALLQVLRAARVETALRLASQALQLYAVVAAREVTAMELFQAVLAVVALLLIIKMDKLEV
jgi:hypothetical protein